MPVVIKAELRKTKDIMNFIPGDLDLKVGDMCVVDTESGQEIARIVSPEKMMEKIKERLCRVKRKMVPSDKQKIKDNEIKSREAFYKVLGKVKERELEMKLTAVDYTFDRSKLFIYYTAEGRIDFRELVKDLGYIFKTRIQMVQIGVRDETKLTGGFGHCGRELCCCSYMKNFKPVSIDMAKEQELSLNPVKISGVCGRLMCCLAYENEFYKGARKKCPRRGAKVSTKRGKGVIKERNFLKNEVTVKYEGGETEKISIDEISIDEISSVFLRKFGKKKEKRNDGRK